jgi:hypothetical protein
MNPRWEVSESTWLRSFSRLENPAVDYVVVEVGVEGPRPWLEAARDSAELIGRIDGVATPALVARALELDVDFLCLVGDQPELDPKRLPLRLIVENSDDQALDHTDLFGAAWARRVPGWVAEEPARLAEMARRERIFLAAADVMPDPRIVASIMPFAVALPEGASAADLANWKQV